MASSSSFSALPLPSLTGKNYEIWCIRMYAYLKGQGTWEHVDTRYTKPNVETIAAMTTTKKKLYDEGKKIETRAKTFILSALDYSMLPKVTWGINAKVA